MKTLWIEIFLIILIGCFFSYLSRHFLAGISYLFIFFVSPLITGLIGSRLISKKNVNFAIYLPAILAVVVEIILAIPDGIRFSNLTDAEFQKDILNHPEIAKYTLEQFKANAIAGRFASVMLFSPIFFISSFIGAWINIKHFAKSKE